MLKIIGIIFMLCTPPVGWIGLACIAIGNMRKKRGKK